MNRRNFFKTVTGIIAGIFLLKRAEPTVYSLWREGKPVLAEAFEREGLHTGKCATEVQGMLRSGTEFICNTLCDCSEQTMEPLDNGIMVSCPHRLPYIITQDGEISEEFTRSQWVSFSETDEKWHFLVSDYYGGEKVKFYIDGIEQLNKWEEI